MCWLSTTVIWQVRPARMGDLKRFDIVVSDCCPEDEYAVRADAAHG